MTVAQRFLAGDRSNRPSSPVGTADNEIQSSLRDPASQSSATHVCVVQNSLNMSNRLLGPLCIFVAASLWGLSAALAKLLFTNNVDTLLVVQTRSSFAFLLLLPVVLFKRDLLILNPRTLLRILPLGVIGVAGANYTYYYAVSKTTVATAIILQYTAPILVAFYELIVERKKLSFSDVSIIMLVFFGSCITVTGLWPTKPMLGKSITGLGLLAGVASAFCWAFFNVYERKIADIPMGAKIFNALLFATLFWSLVQSPAVLSQKISHPNLLWSLIGFAFLSVLLPYLFYLPGLRLSGALSSIVMANAEPVMAIVFSAYIVKETVTLTQMVGAVCVIFGATLFNLRAIEKP